MRGYIIYEGPSRINGDPIVAVATGFLGSLNPKTGSMIQIYIISSTMHPLDAVKCGANSAVCGNCPMKRKIVNGKMEGGCYVNIGQGPSNIYKTYKAGKYPKLPSYELFRGRAVRFGAYGEPTAIPLEVIESIANVANNWTGYTHRWQEPENNGYKKYCVASCDSVSLTMKALSLGWDSFRHKKESSPLLPNEIVCPNETTGIQCITCGLCNGRSRKSVVITRHGPTAKHFQGD